MPEFANALPTKRFFLEMLTRDISLEDAILDLVDNSVDSVARTRKIPLSESLLDTKTVQKHAARVRQEGIPKIDIEISPSRFRIVDNCGGIDFKSAQEEVFRFGKEAGTSNSRLSVYGIGLKRAIFKLGRLISVESHTLDDGFIVNIDADKWAELDDWKFPIKSLSAARGQKTSGTTIEVGRLHESIRARVSDGQLSIRLHEVISTAYALILDQFVILRINGARVHPEQIPLGLSSKVTPAKEQFEVDDVRVTIIAGLAERVDGEWKGDRAGWYVLCNGRVVVFADRTDLSGWGITSPQFVSKYRGFVGIVFCFSEDPELLPWTTTKRGLNRESRVYQLARNKMSVLSRPVLGFLNSMYASNSDTEEPAERVIADTVHRGDIAKVIDSSARAFAVVKPKAKAVSSNVSIQYKVPAEDVDRVRRAVKKSSWSATKVGQHTFEYFLEKECPR